MDKSLDEIIKSNRSVGQNKRNFGGRGRGRTRGGFQRGGFAGGRRTNVNPQFGNRGRGNNLRSGAVRGQNRIGHSNLNAQTGSLVSTRITDARDKLNFKARQTDARVKLIKKAHGVDARQKLQAKRQKSLEGTVMPSNQLPVNIDMNPSQARVPSVTITNPQARKRKSTDGVYQTKSGTIQVTRKQQPVSTKFGQKPTGKKKMEVGKMIITTSSDSVSSRMPAGSLKSSSTKTNLQYDEGFAPSTMKFRKTVQAPPQITRQPATERLSPLGTRVYVTNLHYSVTEEDIKELFGAIGALRKARFVKQGIAEVVYVNRENALEAINVYNNRELDGIPMQCKLDSSTVPESSSSSSSSSSTSAAKSTSRPISDRFKFTRTQSAGIESSGTMRADDVEANLIHKALFKSAANEPTKPVVFTVKI